MTIKGQRGFALILVLVLMALGAMAVTPALRLASTSLKSKAIHTEILEDQYARDGATEYAIWQLQYGTATSDLDINNDETTSIVVLNGITTNLKIKMRTELGTSGVAGGEGNSLRITQSVECDKDSDGFDDDCMALPIQTGMVARFTISLTQTGPDTVPLEYMYEEYPEKFVFRPGTLASPDSSFLEILPEIVDFPENIGSSQNQIWKWDFSSDPVTFVQDQVKTFTFEADIPSQESLYCNGVFLKLQQPPNEKADKAEANVKVGNKEDDGCKGGGMVSEKFADTLVVPPGQLTVITYIANVTNIENNSAKILVLKDVLPQGGFQWCDPANPPSGFTCEAPMYKVVADPFDPLVDSFTDTSGYTNLPDPVRTFNNGRWELVWDNGGSGWNMGQAGKVDDTFTIRFQSHVTPTESGSYFNEIFADVNCTAPNPLKDSPVSVTSNQEYCASYSWPTGGTLVPMYDVNSAAERTSGQGNISVGVGTTSLESWYVDDL